ncbi:phosphotransferase [Neolewinella agarilytica]|nr:phosphotransferase [Neolewinella agarilytica]
MKTNAERFRNETGSEWYLTADTPEVTQRYLDQLGFLLPAERILATTVAGEGNMNLALRVFTDRRHFILKQSRPWVAKFPDLAAPVNRILVERDYQSITTENRQLSGHSPELLKADPANFALLMEDLGGAKDLSAVYQEKESLSDRELEDMLRYLSILHQLPVDDFPANRELRRLNHAHMFDLPFRPDNGFPLDALYPGLAKVARPFQYDEKLRAVALELGEIYLSDGPHLVHGDFYPGSLMSDKGHLYVIDGEFAHPGRPAFDLGVLTAHLSLAGATASQMEMIGKLYDPPGDFDASLANSFCQIEIMRRLIGIAQLPLPLSLDERQKRLDVARSALLN